MAITDISISEELMTGAPSIKYRGNEGPKSPEQERMMMADEVLDEAYEQYIFDLLENRPDATPMSKDEFRRMIIMEGMIGKGPVLPSPEDPINPFAPKPTGPVLPDRQMAAFGGIMGMDGRKQYGIGSFFQKYIMDPIKENPLVAAAVAAGGYDLYNRGEDSVVGSIYNNPVVQDILFGKEIKTEKEPSSTDIGKTEREGGLVNSLIKNLIPIAGGAAAGLFTKNQPEQPGLPSDETAIQLADLKKTANILDQQQGIAAGLNFLPDVAARKFTPKQMIETYAQAAANGGRIGFSNGGDYEDKFMELVAQLREMGFSQQEAIEEARKQLDNNMAYGGRIGFSDGGEDLSDDPNYKGWLKTYEMNPDAAEMNENHAKYLSFYNRNKNNKAEGGLMDLGGLEKDYRAEGGFVPIGKREKADDVPARLSVNEFVFTADAVRNAGGGDVDEGAKVMERVMKNLEAGGQMSRESQGMGGARDMFAVSERLSEVV